MRAAGQPDAFVVINGPEDGVEYTVVRAPFHVGSDETCNVLLRLDKSVSPHHALVTVVSQGYRIRSLGNSPVRVDGKRATMLRSRIVRNGGVVNVGHTQLALDCAPDGLAHRSKGIVSESDLGWFAQEAIRYGIRSLKRAGIFGMSLLGRVFSSWIAIFAVAIVVYLTVPQVHGFVNGVIGWIAFEIRALFEPLLY